MGSLFPKCSHIAKVVMMYRWYMAQYVMNGFRELSYDKNHLFVQFGL